MLSFWRDGPAETLGDPSVTGPRLPRPRRLAMRRAERLWVGALPAGALLFCVLGQTCDNVFLELLTDEAPASVQGREAPLRA